MTLEDLEKYKSNPILNDKMFALLILQSMCPTHWDRWRTRWCRFSNGALGFAYETKDLDPKELDEYEEIKGFREKCAELRKNGRSWDFMR